MRHLPLILLLFSTILLLVSWATAAPATITLPNGDIATTENFTVAFIGDSADGERFQWVLDLIQAENSDLVLHLGDFAYDTDISTWENMINNTLGATFPVVGPDGNHDDWSIYVPFFQARLDAMNVSPNPLATGDESYTFAYEGLKVVFTEREGNPSFINTSLSGDNHIWKVCGWHHNMEAMQIGGKEDEQGWGDYEACRQQGAIIATAHEHSYQRTRTLINTEFQTIDVSCPDDPNTADVDVCVSAGRNFVFVSGLGGHSSREQERCLPTTYPYGCQGEWAKIYAKQQMPASKHKFGALFITFYVDGDPYKARAYFKNTRGDIVDSFDIYATEDKMPDLSIAIDMSTLTLSWQDLGDHIDHYEIWRNPTPYFSTEDGTAVNLNNHLTIAQHGTQVLFDDSVAGSDGNNYFYLVEVVGNNNQTMFKEVGKFSFGVVAGTG